MSFSPTLVGSSNSTIKSHNLRAILLILLRQQGISRVRLAQRTGLSTTTITNLISELLESGIVAEEGLEQDADVTSHAQRSVGRPRTALRLVPDSCYALGIHIGVGRVRVAVTDLLARPVASQVLYAAPEMAVETVVAHISETAQAVIAASGAPREKLLGVGVGASGLVDIRTGVNILSPNLGWKNAPLHDWFAEQLGLPVCVDNNVRAMALGEALFGLGQEVDALAFVYGRIGVGAGFVFRGQLFHGSGAGAGEIGHMTILTNGGEPCRCGNTGCLEPLVSEPVILEEALRLADRRPESALAHALHAADAPAIDAVFAAARAGDDTARELLEARACYLGVALANLVNILNPNLIILGGLFAQGADLLLPTARAVMQERAFANLGAHVRLEITGFGQQAGVIGAASLALDRFFYQQQMEIY